MLKWIRQHTLEYNKCEYYFCKNGFATYSRADKDTVYVQDIFIPKDRRGEIDRGYLDEFFIFLSRDLNYKYVIGSVQKDYKNCEKSKHLMTKYWGFKFNNETEDTIYYKRKI